MANNLSGLPAVSINCVKLLIEVVKNTGLQISDFETKNQKNLIFLL